MSATHHISLPADADLFAHLRGMVEDGMEDGAVVVSRDGKPSLRVSSLYRGALTACAHEPSLRFVAWSPHPNSTVGPRVARLLALRAERKAKRA